jgi:hypothetical protein
MKIIIFVLVTLMTVMIAGCAPGAPVQINTPVPNPKAGTPIPNGQINVPGVSIQVYAPGPNPLVNTPDPHGSAAGILLGIWHGIISPVTMVMSFVNKNGQMYEVHNNGSQYNLGFLIGVTLLFVILAAVFGSRRR